MREQTRRKACSTASCSSTGCCPRIERAGMDGKTLIGAKPIVAALPGTALGIGYELALACHHIVAADNPRPGLDCRKSSWASFLAQGARRLVRKLGVVAAAPFLLEGKLSDPAAARAAGLIDEVVPTETLLAGARLGAERPALRSGEALGRQGLSHARRNALHARGFRHLPCRFCDGTRQDDGRSARGEALLSAVYEGALVPFDTALKIEARWFVNLMLNPSSRAMIRSLFISKEALSKGRTARPCRMKRSGSACWARA